MVRARARAGSAAVGSPPSRPASSGGRWWAAALRGRARPGRPARRGSAAAPGGPGSARSAARGPPAGRGRRAPSATTRRGSASDVDRPAPERRSGRRVQTSTSSLERRHAGAGQPADLSGRSLGGVALATRPGPAASHGPRPYHDRHSSTWNMTRIQGTGWGSPGKQPVDGRRWCRRPRWPSAGSGAQPAWTKAWTSAATSLAHPATRRPARASAGRARRRARSASSGTQPHRCEDLMADLVQHRRGVVEVVARQLDGGDRGHAGLVPQAHARPEDRGAQALVEVDERRRRLDAERAQDHVEAVGREGVEPAEHGGQPGVGAGADGVAVEVEDGLHLEVPLPQAAATAAGQRTRSSPPARAASSRGRLEGQAGHGGTQRFAQAQAQVVLQPGPRRGARRRRRGRRARRSALPPVADLGQQLPPLGVGVSHGGTPAGSSAWVPRACRRRPLAR